MRRFFNFFPLSLLWFSLIIGLNCRNQSANKNENSITLALLALNSLESAKQCTTTYNNDANNSLTNLLELCTPSAGVGRHFRFENVGMTSNNGYLNLLIGYGNYVANTNTTDFPQVAGFGGSFSPTTNSGDGRWRIFFGKSQSCNRVWLSPYFSGTNSGTISLHNLFMTQAVTTTFSAGTCPASQGGLNQPSGIWGPSTICMDISKGDGVNSPRLTVWATGINSADCSNLSSLTKSNSIYEKIDWSSKVSTNDAKNYVYRSNDGTSLDRILVRSETILKD